MSSQARVLSHESKAQAHNATVSPDRNRVNTIEQFQGIRPFGHTILETRLGGW